MKMKNRKISFIKIEKKDGQEFFKLLKNYFKNRNIINRKFRVEQESNYILIPLIEDKTLVESLIKIIINKIAFQIISREGKLNFKFKHKTLHNTLKNEIPYEFLELIPKSYDILGTIAIVEFDKSKDLYDKDLISIKKRIAKGIIQLNSSVKTVFEKKSEIKGNYRLRELELLLGEKNYETIYKENNCFFKLDIRNTFFTPRLVYERKRISSGNIKENELIIDLFAGVGPFSIQIAKKLQVNIHSFDINRFAYNYLKENIGLNKLKGRVIPHNIDINTLLDPTSSLGSMLKNKANRIIMNLPEKSLNFIVVACFLMKKSGGILHIYQFCERPNPIEKAKDKVNNSLKKLNWYIEEVINSKIVKSYSPKSDLVVIDLKIKFLK